MEAGRPTGEEVAVEMEDNREMTNNHWFKIRNNPWPLAQPPEEKIVVDVETENPLKGKQKESEHTISYIDVSITNSGK